MTRANAAGGPIRQTWHRMMMVCDCECGGGGITNRFPGKWQPLRPRATGSPLLQRSRAVFGSLAHVFTVTLRYSSAGRSVGAGVTFTLIRRRCNRRRRRR